MIITYFAVLALVLVPTGLYAHLFRVTRAAEIAELLRDDFFGHYLGTFDPPKQLVLSLFDEAPTLRLAA